MRKKKFLSLLLVITIFLLLAGCGKAQEEESDSTSNNPSSKDEEPMKLTANYTINADRQTLNETSEISDILYGIFIEDINFAIDGGLYVELVKNRSFEYGSVAANENRHGWINSNPSILEFDIIDGSIDKTHLNENNPTYARLSNSSSSYEGIANVGYLDGLAVNDNETYIFSAYLKTDSNYSDPIRVSLYNKDGTIYAEDTIDQISDEWHKYDLSFNSANKVSKDLYLSVEIMAGSVDIDMVSLMAEESYHNTKIRQDIGQYIADLNPSFIRFPGGCVIEGRDEESIYNWKDSIGNGLEFTINGETSLGDVATRPQGKSIWNGNRNHPYYTTYGIGFYEYFLLCEAVDALAIPVLNAGMTCEVQSPKYIVYPLNSLEFYQYLQDALDLVEFCRGGEDTYWGSLRIAMGQEEPFQLKYIAIGNEQWQSEYFAHYQAFVEAFEEAAISNPEMYGDIELIVANGTMSGSREGWHYLDTHPDDKITTLVDEHYYESPNWYLTNTKRYDKYDRDASAKVFLGEYAAQSNNLQAALAEAAYMTGIERNSDIIKMACYAPLFGNSTNNQWLPDLMFFSNTEIHGSINYYVQQIFAQNVASNLLPGTLDISENQADNDLAGYVGLASWRTSVAYDNLLVTSNESGDVLYSTDFESDTSLQDDNWTHHQGDWNIEDGRLIQSNTSGPSDGNTGDAIYVGDPGWTNYTLTVDGEILSGEEGFLIPVCVTNTNNNIFWNIGGWGNTVSCLQVISAGSKSGQVSGTAKSLKLNKNQVYQLKIVVDGTNIKCYIDDILYIDYTQETPSTLYETTSIDDNGDIIIKYVNISDRDIDIDTLITNIDFTNYQDKATLTLLTGDKLSATNSFKHENNIVPVISEIDVSDNFTYTAPSYSVSIIRITAK